MDTIDSTSYYLCIAMCNRDGLAMDYSYMAARDDCIYRVLPFSDPRYMRLWIERHPPGSPMHGWWLWPKQFIRVATRQEVEEAYPDKATMLDLVIDNKTLFGKSCVK